MKLTTLDSIALIWLALLNALALALFALDKRLSSRRGASRISEFHLLLVCALGGWPGGLCAMLLFRHKTAKTSFKLKFAVSFLCWCGLVWFYANAR